MFKTMKRHTAVPGKHLGGLVLSILALVVLTACGSSSAGDGSKNSAGGRSDLLTLGVAFAPSTLDPGLLGAASSWTWMMDLAYEPLIRFEPDGSFGPALATKWKYTDPKTFEVTLRDGVKFADGTALDAKAAAASMTRALKQPGTTQAWSSNVSKVESTGPLALKVTCSSSCPELEFLFSQNVQLADIVSPAGLANEKKLATETFGAGPYVLNTKETVTNDHYTFEPNPNYYDKSRIHYNKVVYRVIADNNARISALKAGQVDLIDNVPADLGKSIQSGGLELYKAPCCFFGIQILDRGGEMVPALKDVRVRQALNFAIDRDAITDAVGQGSAQGTAQMTGTGSGAYDASLDQMYPYDVDKAKQLLKEAGYGDGFSMKVETQATSPNMAKYTQAVISYWEKVGIKVDLTTEPTVDAWLSNASAKKFPVSSYLYGTLPYSLQANNFFVPSSGGPFNGWVADPEITALLSQAKDATATESESIYKEINKRATEQAFNVGLGQLDLYYGHKSGVNVPAASPENAIPVITDVTTD